MYGCLVNAFAASFAIREPSQLICHANLILGYYKKGILASSRVRSNFNERKHDEKASLRLHPEHSSQRGSKCIFQMLGKKISN